MPIFNRWRQRFTENFVAGANENAARAVKFWRFIVLLVAAIWRHKTFLLASALSFTTLLSIVPVILIGMAILTTFGAEHGVTYADTFLNAIEERVPQIPALRPLLNLLHQIVNRAHEIAGIGFLSLGYLAYSLLSSTEWCFNYIWQVEQYRPWWRRLAAYFVIVLFVPALLSFSVYFNLEIASLVNKAAQHAEQIGNTLWSVASDAPPVLVAETTSILSQLALSGLSLLMTAAALTGLMYLMPHTRVRFSAAIAGGLVSGILIEATHYGFGLYAHYATENLTQLYGSTLLFVPLALVWIWLTWAFVLLGAEVAFARQNYKKTPA